MKPIHGTDLVPTECLGQSGVKMRFGGSVLYIDPYLTNSVERAEGPHMRRLSPIPYAPDAVSDADWVLITHSHRDHCDPDTLVPLAAASPDAIFLCPHNVASILAQAGIEPKRIITATEQWLDLGTELRVRPVPAAHPTIERDMQGNALAIGFVIEWRSRRFYHSGDTVVDHSLLAAITDFAPMDVVFLPVNEHNLFKDQLGIIGNMTVREASGLAKALGARILVPLHWDMFESNRVFREELEGFFAHDDLPFTAMFSPTKI